MMQRRSIPLISEAFPDLTHSTDSVRLLENRTIHHFTTTLT